MTKGCPRQAARHPFALMVGMRAKQQDQSYRCHFVAPGALPAGDKGLLALMVGKRAKQKSHSQYCHSFAPGAHRGRRAAGSRQQGSLWL
eukprot:1160596-Pelagomonas_calceolata.AAC.3